MKIILLLDMDYFFAACEELRHPEYKNKPIVVGADPKGGTARGVVSTSNYLARKFGIHSAMPISSAYRLKPDAIFLPVDYNYYESMSAKVMQIVKVYASKFEQVSIDEAFLDITQKVGNYQLAVDYAKKIKEEIKLKTGLPCSIGISSNRVLAKMACEAAKPDGIKLVLPDEGATFLAPMKIGKLYGVGKKSDEKLRALGYDTIGKLAKANLPSLFNEFGIWGGELYRNANGQGDDTIVENYQTKSIGRERTFENDTSDRAKVVEQIGLVSKEVCQEAKKQGFSYKTITVKIRYSDFEEHLKSKSLGHYSQDLSELVKNAMELFDISAEQNRPIRKVGVRISGFGKSTGQTKITDFVRLP